MAVSSIDTSTTANTTTAKADAFGSLKSEEFVRIIFAELQNQDPLKPNDSAQLVQQMANLRSIQSDIDMQKKLGDLVSQNQLATAGNLVGKYISGISQGNERVEGVVATVSRTNDGAVLNLTSGERVPMSKVDEITNALSQTGPFGR